MLHNLQNFEGRWEFSRIAIESLSKLTVYSKTDKFQQISI